MLIDAYSINMSFHWPPKKSVRTSFGNWCCEHKHHLTILRCHSGCDQKPSSSECRSSLLSLLSSYHIMTS